MGKPVKACAENGEAARRLQSRQLWVNVFAASVNLARLLANLPDTLSDRLRALSDWFSC